jgi:hypothetical protein
MNKKEIRTLVLAIALSLAAATSVNAGFVELYSTPNDLPDMSYLLELYSTPNSLPDIPYLLDLYSTPNDLPSPLYTEYFTCALLPNEKITVAALMFTNTRSKTKERDDRGFINQGVGKPQNFNVATDFYKLGFWNVLSASAETTHGTYQANLELKITPIYIDWGQ